MKRTAAIILGVVFLLLLLHLLIALADAALLAPWRSGFSANELPFFPAVGVTHVHSRHSDGSGSLADIVRAARRCRLDFVWITDHNTLALRDSATTTSFPVVLIGAELSLKPGHLLEYGLPQLPDEETFGGAAAIADSARRSGGMAFVAHPFHPKIRWRAAFPSAAGLEILNADVEWRNDAPLELLGAIFAYPFFDHAMNLLLDRPQRELELWDRTLARRHTVGIGSVDAHARIKLSRTSYWPFPSYERTFAMIQNVLYLRKPLAGEPHAAKGQILRALRSGRLAFGFAGLGDLRAAQIWLESGGGRFAPGDSVGWATAQQIRVKLPRSGRFEVALYKNGVRIARSQLHDVHWRLQGPGVYRVAVSQRRIQIRSLGRRTIPWLYANPFYVYSEKSSGESRP